MVNPGYPSRACEACKRLKSKCGEERPSCGRCARRGRKCVYTFRDPVFRSMNKWSEVNVQSRVSEKLLAGSCTPTPPMQLSLDWKVQSVGPFFDHFVAYPDCLSSTRGFLPFLPMVYSKLPTKSYMAEAVHACAFANMANASNIKNLEVWASKCYGNAIKGLHAALQGNTKIATSDEALSTMILLTMYETISGTKPPNQLWYVHARGQSAAIRLRAAQQVNSTVSKTLLGHTNRWLIWRDLNQRQRPTFSLTEWPAGTYRSWLDERSAQLCSLAADLCGRVRELLEDSASAPYADVLEEELESCIHDIVELDDAIKATFLEAPKDWLPTTVAGLWTPTSAFADDTSIEDISNLRCPVAKLSSSPKSQRLGKDTDPSGELYRPRLDHYPSQPVAFLWNYIRCARLHLLRSMIDLRVVESSQSSHLYIAFPTPPSLLDSLSSTIHDICATVPYLLGDPAVHQDIGGAVYQCRTSDLAALLFPLHKICSVPGLAPEIEAWAVNLFERIGTHDNISSYTHGQEGISKYTSTAWSTNQLETLSLNPRHADPFAHCF